MISDEEWENYDWKHVINCDKNGLLLKERTCNKRIFIAFHTPEQREEFMSYPENRTLVEQYYMI